MITGLGRLHLSSRASGVNDVAVSGGVATGQTAAETAALIANIGIDAVATAGGVPTGQGASATAADILAEGVQDGVDDVAEAGGVSTGDTASNTAHAIHEAAGGIIFKDVNLAGLGIEYDDDDTVVNLFQFTGAVSYTLAIVMKTPDGSGLMVVDGTADLEVGVTADTDKHFGPTNMAVCEDPITGGAIATTQGASWGLNHAPTLQSATSTYIAMKIANIDGAPGTFALVGTVTLILAWKPTVEGSGAAASAVS